MKHVVAVLLVVCLATAVAFAQNGTPSAKAGATIRTLNCAYGADAYNTWVNVGDPVTLKVNNVNDMFVGVSLETGLYTLTRVSTKVNSTTGLPEESKAIATAGVKVRVVLDGNEMETPLVPPGEVTFDQRIQTLSATLGQALTGCTIVNGVVQCTGLTTQQIELILDTLGAHSFNFVKANPGVGVHTLQVQFKLNKDAVDDGTSSSAIGKACAGLGTVTVESVRMANYIDF